MPDQFSGFKRPNSTDTPDEWYLQVAPRIRHISEMKVMLYIIYRTFGWRKWDDWISLSQFEDGQSRRADDGGCGLSHAGILEGLELAVEHGYARCRLLCSRCNEEVVKSEIEERPWKNRHGEGIKQIPVVPQVCPHCGEQLRGFERPYYRLAFEDDIVNTYDSPQSFLAKYGAHPQVETGRPGLENSTSPKVENPRPKVENPSSKPQKLEISTLQSTSSHSTIHSPDHDDDDGLLIDLIDLGGLQERAARMVLDRYGSDGASQWLAFVLDRQKTDPAAYLYACCVKKHELPPAHYAKQEIEAIRRRYRALYEYEDSDCDRDVVDQDPDEPDDREEVPLEECPMVTDQIRELWSLCCEELNASMTNGTFTTWVKPCMLREVDVPNKRATIAAPTQPIYEWMRYRLDLAVRRVLGPMIGLAIGELRITYLLDEEMIKSGHSPPLREGRRVVVTLPPEIGAETGAMTL